MKVGEIRTKREICQWRECEECGLPAKWRITFLLDNARNNPTSSAFRHDDCTWCSDLAVFACGKCEKELRINPPQGYKWCAAFPLKRYKHMGFYWRELKEKSLANSKVVI